MKIDTIAAIATARGQSGIGVIRVSGPRSIQIVDEIFVSYSGKNIREIPGYTARYGKIYDNDECVDEVVVLLFRAPHSYTGEDVVEISCHGGSFVTERVLRLVIDHGANIAGPGEFTKRAFLNGKMDLTQAESIMDIIAAKGKEASKAALAMRDGVLSKKINEVKSLLINSAAEISAVVDYPDDDIPEIDFEKVKMDLNLSEKELFKLIGTYGSGKILKDGIDTAIVGKPNVGKSTLMNFLSGCERCIVTNIPGTTRDIVEENITLGNITLNVSDTAGVRSTDDPVEMIGVNKTKEKINTAQLILILFDSSRELNDEDVDLINMMKNRTVIAIINKIDLPKKLNDKYIKEKIKDVIYFSATNGEGLEELEKKIEDIAGIKNFDCFQGFISNIRQYLAAKEALECIKEAKRAINEEMTIDAIGISIEAAIEFLLQLTGERATEKITDEVFSKFCVGK